MLQYKEQAQIIEMKMKREIGFRTKVFLYEEDLCELNKLDGDVEGDGHHSLIMCVDVQRRESERGRKK